jgi:hypothetical protein
MVPTPWTGELMLVLANATECRIRNQQNTQV